MNKRRFFSLCLALLLMLFIPFAIADSTPSYFSVQDALSAGKEIVSSVGFQWYSPSDLLDERTNAGIASLLESLDLQFRSSSNENSNYSQGSLLLSDYPVVEYEVLVEDGVPYIRLFDNEPFVLPMSELEGFYQNLRSYLIRMEIFTEEDLQEFEAGLTEAVAELTAAAEDQMASLQIPAEMPASFAEVVEVLSGWAESSLSGEEKAEGGVSWYGEEAVQSVVYDLTAEEIVDFFHLLGKTALEHPTFISDLFTLIQSAESTVSFEFEGEAISGPEDLTEMFEAFQTLSISDFPPEFSAVYTLYQDENASPVFSEAILHAADEDALLSFSTEFSHLQTAFYFTLSFDDGYDPFEILFTVLKDPEQIEETEVGTSRSSMLNVVLELKVDSQSYPFTFSIDQNELEGSTVSSKDVTVALATELMGSEYTIYGVYNHLLSTLAGYSATYDVTLGFSLGDSVLPVAGVQASVDAQEPQGCSFEASSAAHPGTMTENEFTIWMNALLSSVLERVMNVTAYLPQETLALLSGAPIEEDAEMTAENASEFVPEEPEAVEEEPAAENIFAMDSFPEEEEETESSVTENEPKTETGRNVWAGLGD